jgi:FlaA1/EpsC-like NDP-sugar epimerase
MAVRDLTARRSGSARAHVRQTRSIAGLAVLVLAAAIASDRLANRFWRRHLLLTSLVSSFVVVAVSVAVVNEALERRHRRRWIVLAQYVLFELVRTARLTWTGLMEVLGLMHAGEETQASLNAGARTLLDTPCGARGDAGATRRL